MKNRQCRYDSDGFLFTFADIKPHNNEKNILSSGYLARILGMP